MNLTLKVQQNSKIIFFFLENLKNCLKWFDAWALYCNFEPQIETYDINCLFNWKKSGHGTFRNLSRSLFNAAFQYKFTFCF